MLKIKTKYFYFWLIVLIQPCYNMNRNKEIDT